MHAQGCPFLPERQQTGSAEAFCKGMTIWVSSAQELQLCHPYLVSQPQDPLASGEERPPGCIDKWLCHSQSIATDLKQLQHEGEGGVYNLQQGPFVILSPELILACQDAQRNQPSVQGLRVLHRYECTGSGLCICSLQADRGVHAARGAGAEKVHSRPPGGGACTNISCEDQGSCASTGGAFSTCAPQKPSGSIAENP